MRHSENRGHECPFRKKADRRRRFARNRSRPRFELLENRIVLASYTVTSILYPAATVGTLAYEIGQAITNNDSAAVIGFSASLAGETISLTSADFSATNTYVQVSHFWRGLATNTLMYNSAGFRPR
jgi:hypothetical protein